MPRVAIGVREGFGYATLVFFRGIRSSQRVQYLVNTAGIVERTSFKDLNSAFLNSRVRLARSPTANNSARVSQQWSRKYAVHVLQQARGCAVGRLR